MIVDHFLLLRVAKFKKFFSSKIQDNNDKLAYWLSNSSTLLLLLQRTLKTTGAAGLTPQRRRSSAASFGRVFSVKIYFFSVSNPQFFILKIA
jgi:hypothetical protein